MARVSPLMLLPLVVAGGFFAMAFWGMKRDNPDDLPSTLIGRPAADVQLTQLGTMPGFSPADLADGRVKIVNFWASWCAPCRAEHPNLVRLQSEGLPIYGVNYKDKPDAALAFLADLGNPFERIGADASGRMGIDWGLYGVPESFVIDGEGKVILRFPGPITDRALQSDIRPALAKAAGQP
jgi:cytochrome c biogenesis protein CcmG/thiol:disulfide interchange protein DsbE